MLTMKDVIKEGNLNLHKISKDVPIPLSKKDKSTLLSLHEYVVNSTNEEMQKKYDFRPSVGIAAPQINILKRLTAIHVKDLDGILYSYMLINPVITKKSGELVYLPGGEGCLSVDRKTEGLTPRYKEITLESYAYLSQTDEIIKIRLHLSGYVGIIFQHEIDHLNGILYTQKLFSSLPSAKPVFEELISED